MLGWRKLGAWLLVFAFAAVATFVGKEIPARNADLVQWVTLFFFGANALKPLFEKVPLVEKLAAK
jgi:hypothetical protein